MKVRIFQLLMFLFILAGGLTAQAQTFLYPINPAPDPLYQVLEADLYRSAGVPPPAEPRTQFYVDQAGNTIMVMPLGERWFLLQEGKYNFLDTIAGPR